MQRELLITKDGSHTISVPELNVTYHSIHGAIQESLHVFIKEGFNSIEIPGNGPCNILEIGFGTGLNALLTVIEAEKRNRSIYYAALEPHPLSMEQVHSLNYCELLERPDLQEDFIGMHSFDWNKSKMISPHFILHKSTSSLQQFEHKTGFHLVYFDAFAPGAQPELWTIAAFEKVYNLLEPGGTLVTYCSKGDVRRAMQTAGFLVEKLPGPPGKREMVRARKMD